MSNDAPELSKGVFGYRKSVVNQIIADRDIMLRQAEGRVRAAEGKVAELESELQTTRERNERMEEQLDRLRSQLDSLLNRVDDLEAGPADDASAGAAPVGAQPEPPEAEPVSAAPWAEPVGWLQEAPDAEAEDVVEPDPTLEPEPFVAAEEGPDRPDDAPSDPSGFEIPPFDEAAMFGEPVDAPDEGTTEEDDMPFGYQASLEPDPASPRPAWMDLDDEETSADPDEVVEASVSAEAVIEQPDDEPSWAAEHDPFAEERGSEGAGEFPAPAPEASLWHEAAPMDDAVEAVAPAPETPAWMDDDEDEDASGGESYAWASLDEPGALETAAGEQPAGSASAEDEDVLEAPAASGEEPEPPKPGVSPETSDITNRFVTKELGGILAAAEESAARIVERARSTSQRQVAHSNRLWREVQSEVSRFADWRDDVEPVIRAVQDKVDGVRSQIEQVPERIRQALAPMAEAIASIDADLAELAAAANPPLLLAPSGLEDAMEEDWDLDLEDPESSGNVGDQPSPEADAG